ncbi:hypothetical protein WR25_06117 [Diploscapter pachys]|uniref:RRM domain-containing protein n=1 Tax=Diploscapter pachys TaxID=2018661 RepID=A0A2A2LDF7_9BILA|nr:hypothetical protein WR25_06117 [Diploscapter pachys]
MHISRSPVGDVIPEPRQRTRTRSRTFSRSPVRRHSNRHSRSRTPPARRGGRFPANKRDNPDPSRCLGVFNLSVYTTDKDVKELFGEFGDIDKVDLIYDHPTGRSRGFGFVYFDRVECATKARDKLNGSEVDGHKIRVDYSLTKRAHTPTPGQYMGYPPRKPSRYEERHDSRRDDRFRGPPPRKDYFAENRIFGKNRQSYKSGYYGEAQKASPVKSSHR